MFETAEVALKKTLDAINVLIIETCEGGSLAENRFAVKMRAHAISLRNAIAEAQGKAPLEAPDPTKGGD